MLPDRNGRAPEANAKKEISTDVGKLILVCCVVQKTSVRSTAGRYNASMRLGARGVYGCTLAPLLV
jgi:hypothetical protein